MTLYFIKRHGYKEYLIKKSSTKEKKYQLSPDREFPVKLFRKNLYTLRGLFFRKWEYETVPEIAVKTALEETLGELFFDLIKYIEWEDYKTIKEKYNRKAISEFKELINFIKTPLGKQL